MESGSHFKKYFKRYVGGFILLIIIAALWQVKRQEPCYRLGVNFEGVSAPPNWSYLQKLLYLVHYGDWSKGRFGWRLVAGNEFDFNRFPTVPPGPCKIDFNEMCYYPNDEMDSESMVLVVDIPRPGTEDEMEVYAKDCPGLVAVLADGQCRTHDLYDCENTMTPVEAAAELGMFYCPAESGDKLYVPFTTGRVSLHLIIKDERELKGWHAHSVVICPLKK